jgi:hypothetical protein
MHPAFRFIYTFLNKKWHFDQIVNELIAVKSMNFGYLSSFKTFDKGLIEQFGPSGLSASTFNVSFNVIAFQSGFIYHTIFGFVCFFCLYFFAFFLMSIGFFVTVNNVQFFLILFGFSLVCLSKTV